MLTVPALRFGLKSPAAVAAENDLQDAQANVVPLNDSTAIQHGLHQAFPSLSTNLSAPLSSMLASPVKQAGMLGILGGALGSLAPRLFQMAEHGHTGALSAGLAGISAVAGSVMGYIARKHKNDELLFFMNRGVDTEYGLERDPVYQARLSRQAGSSALLDTALTASLLTNGFNSNPFSRPSYSSYSRSR